jgi:hypothetical protein
VDSEYGEYNSEAEVRAEYAEAKRRILEEGGPLARLAVLWLIAIRMQTIRNLRKMTRAAAG